MGCSRGLALFWDMRNIAPLWWISSHSSLSMVTSSLDSGELILVTNIYALNNFHEKPLLWSHIRYVKSCAPFLPWILVGDFNSMLSLEEKRGGLAWLSSSNDLFS